VFYPNRLCAWRGSGAVLDTNDEPLNLLSTAHLSADKVAALVTWTNNVVRERRLKQVADATVTALLMHWMPTVGHVMARFPVLALLAQEQPWKARFHQPPQRLRRYEWPADGPAAEARACYEKAMRATEVVLTSATMLDKPSPLAWERLANDRKYD
jgi:hypothetical protein